MIQNLLQNALIAGGLRLLTGLLALAAAWAVASLLRWNKGAKVNRAWTMLAIGLIFVAFSHSIRFAFDFLIGGPDPGAWDDVVGAVGMLLVLFAALDWRGQIRRMTK